MRERAKKFLGQHFLVNRGAILKIIDALEIKDGDTIIEIGPGNGELTLPLAKRAEEVSSSKYQVSSIKIIAIEKDPRLAEDLRNKIHDLGFENIEIITGDALKILPNLTHNLQQTTSNQATNQLMNYKIAGNIPYYITGRLLRIISELHHKPEITVLTIQKEVAERICAEPKNMNLLAAITQFWANPTIVSRLKNTDFNPPPKINSAVIRLNTKKINHEINPESYYRFIRVLFKQPRKTIINNLVTRLKIPRNDILSLLGMLKIAPGSRPHELSMSMIYLLYQTYIIKQGT